MEFSGQYLTYEEYRGLNGTLDITPFNLLEFEARKQIDKYTFNRLKEIDSSEIPQEVKLCEYALINIINSYTTSINEATNSGNIASENIDGYSVSYLTARDISTITQTRSKELGDIVRDYLLHVIVNGEHIMFCGVE